MNGTPFRALLTHLGTLASRPWAFLVVVLYGILWFVFERQDFNWMGTATLIVWMMTLLIQRAEHRDTQAIQAKLDELLRAHGTASNDLASVDDAEPEDIEKLREQRVKAAR
jgi:low affinity Fe/Cu permease